MTSYAEPLAPPAPISLQIVTLNAHKGFTFFNRRFILHELRAAVREVGADIVFLQEVLGSHRRHSARFSNWPDHPQYEFLADTIWPQFAYGQNAVYPHGDHGNAILTKFPILHHENRDVSIGPPEKRGLLHCVLDLPGRTEALHVICCHLGLREAHREKQLHLMCQMIADEVPHDAPLLVAGDFNDWRERADGILSQGAKLDNAFAQGDHDTPRTFPARCPLLRLDRIYTRNVSVEAPRVLTGRPWSHLSDHAPLVARITL